MKKLFIGVVLPLIATAAVIGSGFSIWMFGDVTNATATNSVDVKVEQVQDSSTFAFTALKSLSLDFDQKTREGATNLPGVHWVYASNEAAASVVTLTKKNDQAINPTSITTTVTVPTSLLTYIVIGGNDGEITADDKAKTTTYTYNWDADDFADNKATWDFKTVTVDYVAGKEPTNADGVKALAEAVSDAKITVTYTANFATK